MYTRKKASPRQINFTITGLNEKALGIAHHRGKKILVEKSLPGEQVRIEYNPARSRKDRVHLKAVLEKSPERVAPPCPYFEHCGGCHLQHLSYPAQLEFKQEVICTLLRENPAAGAVTVHPVVGMPTPMYYRNKSQMPFRRTNGEVAFGLFRSGTHDLIPVDECRVESREANIALRVIRDWARRYHVAPYDETHHAGLLRHAVIRKGTFTNQLMVVLVTTAWEVPHLAHLLPALRNALPGLRSLQVNRNTARTNIILGAESRVVWGTPGIEEQLGKCRFRIYPNTFFQVNSVHFVKLLEKLKKVCDLRPSDRVADLFCGVGVIALSLAGWVAQVTGIEANGAAVAAAQENARDNGISNVRFLAGDAGEIFARLRATEPSPAVVIVDPPRKGLTAELIAHIGAATPRKIVYISCNPRTLVRDLGAFRAHGYAAQAIYPFDMFPQTYHVECLAVLQRVDS